MISDCFTQPIAVRPHRTWLRPYPRWVLTHVPQHTRLCAISNSTERRGQFGPLVTRYHDALQMFLRLALQTTAESISLHRMSVDPYYESICLCWQALVGKLIAY